MTTVRDVFSPAGWKPSGAGRTEAGSVVWEKVLRRPERGDVFTLLHFEADASYQVAGQNTTHLLVLDGVLEGALQPGMRGGTEEVEPYRRGAYVECPQGNSRQFKSRTGSVALFIQGDQLGESLRDVFSPRGWVNASPGLWARSLLQGHPGEAWKERAAGLAYLEPGGSAALHPHPTAHLFLFLEGEADDELIYPNGNREAFVRRKGDFIAYPYPLNHRTTSRDGCLLLFVHEPLLYATTPDKARQSQG